MKKFLVSLMMLAFTAFSSAQEPLRLVHVTMEANGIVTLIAAGGTGNFTYNITGINYNQTNATGIFTGVPTNSPSTWLVTSGAASITGNFEPFFDRGQTALALTFEAPCFGQSNGRITVQVFGDGPQIQFFYLNSNSATVSGPPWVHTFTSGASAATLFTVRVEPCDSGGCQGPTFRFPFPAFSAIAFLPGYPLLTNPTCGLPDGSIAINVTGGVPPYRATAVGATTGLHNSVPSTFGENTVATFANLVADSYIVTITDAVRCSFTSAPLVLTESASTIAIQLGTITQPRCNGESGAVAFTVTGGSGPYSACLAPVANPTGCIPTPIIGAAGTREAAAGTYVLFVVDSIGCSAQSAPVTFVEPAELTLNALITQQIRCNGDSNGEISATVSGGTAPYTFFLNGTAVQTSTNTSFVFGNLSGGIPYTISVNDANNCGPVSQTITLTSPDPIAFQVLVEKEHCCKDYRLHNSVEVTNVSGGTEPYTYALEGESRAGCGFISVDKPFTCVKNGKYLVIVKDANGCIGTQEINVK